ncbi:MAG: CHAT domain-containing protein [Pirellulales bacterium]|nr:CHAT domain-containing protein [Pirellulales bacterium]
MLRSVSKVVRLVVYGLVLTLGATLGSPQAWGQRTPARAQTPKQTDRFAERDRLWNDALAQLKAGQRRPAIAAGEKVVAIERRLLGNEHAEVATTLIWLARASTEVEDFAAARKMLDEALAIRAKAFGAKDWRTVDARWEVKHLEAVQKMTAADRREYIRGAQLNRDMESDLDRGDTSRALIKMGELMLLQQKLLPVPDLDLLQGLQTASRFMNRMGEPNSAWGFAQQALAMCQQLYPADACPGSHPQIADCYTRLGGVAFEQGAYALALENYEHALQATELLYPAKTNPNGHPTIADVLDSVALARWRSGNLAGAAQAYERALAMREKLYPPAQFPAGHVDIAMTLNSLGQIAHDREDFTAARKLFDRAIAMLAKVYPQEKFPQGHLDQARVYNNLAVMLDDQGDSVEARRRYEQALAIFERVYSADEYPHGHPDLASALANMGTVLARQDDYVAARKYLERALKIEEQLYPPEQYAAGHPDIARTLNSLGTLLAMQGDFAGAVQFQERSVAMNRQLYPVENYPAGHISLAISLDNLASTQKSRGDYTAARKLYEESLAMRERLYPRQDYPHGNLDLALAHNNLGELLREQGETESALEHYVASATMLETLFSGEEYPNGHPYLAASWSNLASLLREAQEYEAARKLYERSLAMKEKLYPAEQFAKGHSDLIVAYSEYGSLLFDLGEYAAAESQFERAVKMCEKIYPADSYSHGHPQLATAVNNLAYSLRAQEKLPAARAQFERAVAMLEQLYPADAMPAGHPVLATALDNLGTLLATEGRLEEAFALVLRSNEMELASLQNVFGGASEQTMRSYLMKQEGTSDTLMTLASRLDVESRRREAFAAVIERKTALHDALLELRQLERAASKHPDLRDAVERLRTERQTLVDLALLPVTPELTAERQRRTAEANTLETNLNRQLTEVLGAARAGFSNKVDPARLVTRIGDRGAFVEFVRYAPYELSPRGQASERQPPRFAAFVLRGGTLERLSLIDLGPADEIDARVHELRQAVSDVPRELRTSDEKELEEQYRELAQSLAQTIWLPLEGALDGATQIYFCADGELTRLPFEALVDRDGRYLIEKFSMAYVSSASDLLRAAEKPAAGTVVIAAPNYELEAVPAQPTPDVLASRNAADELYRGEVSPDVRGLNWSALPGTRQEAARIQQLLEGQPGYAPVVTLLDDAALEGMLKSLPAPRILHLATHGFYLPDQRARGELADAQTPAAADAPATTGQRLATLRSAENPLLRSGVILAGANRPHSAQAGAQRTDDGWATAEEIGMLDLTGTELVVLSACETGLGDIRTGEGVSGLRRAFLHAGARTLVTSLYKVPDDATQGLMAHFYERLAAGASKQTALRDAQLATMAARRKESSAAHPFFWASFVLVGSPE